CTCALLIAAKVIGVTRGDYVIVPTITWQSTANIVEQLDAIPLFADVERDTLNIKIEDVENYLKKYGDKVKAVIPVHHSGLPVDIDKFNYISKKNGVKIIYDAAHAVFSSYKGEMVGKFGEMSCFSFYATKNITTGDGGIITTNNDEIAEQCRLWSYHGLPKDSWKRYSAENASPHVQSVFWTGRGGIERIGRWARVWGRPGAVGLIRAIAYRRGACSFSMKPACTVSGG
ncbi:MAG: aminotransferase class I/II-fold pyridoxal phosphate-dependent enzyme, partial [Planctomycetes bacterium]|nr:aminotransferase class I/II-fold pyridoxal phosphate-dependent enzyme [Planctomycetota bacterium]